MVAVLEVKTGGLSHVSEFRANAEPFTLVVLNPALSSAGVEPTRVSIVAGPMTVEFDEATWEDAAWQ